MEVEAITSFIQEAGARAYPNEACGLIIQGFKKGVAVECENVAFNPQQHFMIDPKEYCKWADQGDVIGVWHTHVELPPVPSQADLAGCEDTELPWVIVGVRKKEDDFKFEGPNVIEPSGVEIPYLGRPYVSGGLDCFSLVRNYYKREYGIHINDQPRRLEDGSHGHTMFSSLYEEEGFVRLIDQQPEVGDIFLMCVNPENGDMRPNHIAIYIGDDMILHHCRDRLSRRDIYGGGFWQKHTTHHLRWKEWIKC